MDTFNLICLDSPESTKQWLKDRYSLHSFDHAYKLLRANFNSDNSETYLKESILMNPDMHKILMIERDTRKLAGIAVVKERRENGNNLLELHYFTVARKSCGDGARLMALLLQWASRKKFYSEIVAMADLNVVRFFYQNEFVLVDPKEF